MEILPSVDVITAPVEAERQAQIGGFEQRFELIGRRKAGDITADMASELAISCRTFQDALEDERKKLKAPILEAGRKLDEFFGRMDAPVAAVRGKCNQIIAQWHAEKERREKERVQREAEEKRQEAIRQQQAEIDAHVAEAAATNDESLLEEAARLEQEPIIPTAVRQAPIIKTQGASVRAKLVGEVEDPYKLMAWMLEHRGSIGAVWGEKAKGGLYIPQSEINRALKNGLRPDGVKVTKDYGVSNRGK